MLNLYSLSSFVQFVGAFHFANVYLPIQGNLFKYFLNVEDKFASRFGEIREKIQADIESLSSMEPIVTTDGLSTKPSVDKIMDELSKLQDDGGKIESQTKSEIEERFKMGYSRPMFMSFGLYCTFELLVFGVMDMVKHVSIYSSFSFYTLSMWSILIYFIVCEALKTKGASVPGLFCPTHWGMMKVSLLLAILAGVNYFVVENLGSFWMWDYWIVEALSASGILLSVMPFVVVMFITRIHYKLSLGLIKRNTEPLVERYDFIHKEKKTLDTVNAVFTAFGAEIKFE